MQQAASDLDFPFHHGRLALSFAGTLGRRTSDEPIERMPSPARLSAWLHESGLVASRTRLEIDTLTFRRSLDLREAIWRVAQALTAGCKPKRTDVDVMNAAARRWSPAPHLDPVSLRLGPRQGGEPVRAALGRVAFDALELFGDAAVRKRIRACEAGDCSSIFLDPGRGRPRRWCSMARCGNRAKVAAFRARQKD